eukprot:2258793-Rhodomonas_salina.1
MADVGMWLRQGRPGYVICTGGNEIGTLQARSGLSCEGDDESNGTRTSGRRPTTTVSRELHLSPHGCLTISWRAVSAALNVWREQPTLPYDSDLGARSRFWAMNEAMLTMLQKRGIKVAARGPAGGSGGCEAQRRASGDYFCVGSSSTSAVGQQSPSHDPEVRVRDVVDQPRDIRVTHFWTLSGRATNRATRQVDRVGASGAVFESGQHSPLVHTRTERSRSRSQVTGKFEASHGRVSRRAKLN